MEKLQAALENARQKRDSADAPMGEKIQRSEAVVRHGGSSTSGEWSALQPVSLDAKHIMMNRVMTLDASSRSTPFDILRTKILLHMRQNGWKRMALTSPLPSLGKTTTACNLALGFGRQPELRTILCDLDLRSPSVARTLQLDAKAPITPMLLGERSFADHAVRFGENLAIATSSTPMNDPTRVLLAPQTRERLQQIEDSYEPDLMIFDLPSILVGDDTRAFLQHVDCALILVRAEQTKYSQYDACEREVAQYTNVLGAVLNGYRYGDEIYGDKALRT